MRLAIAAGFSAGRLFAPAPDVAESPIVQALADEVEVLEQRAALQEKLIGTLMEEREELRALLDLPPDGSLAL